ncbi:lipid-A-disaccharide synthase [Rivibacter subsaxonicus]|uniref:Lipid-A-disaccharide synthase n=1 Tax=Rivibacter subsaxonicus TaxID=457575 RepID=A0A4Q7V9J6_9BURK|nr:lipid-A-disaccharide synthase [Rivibacter subsaxonicus]RZT92544.1 lipid-A-disaccharide synthase [Rivibacter subsaxonicus]
MKLGLVAGEASGDLLAGLLLQGVNARWPQARSVGIGGPRMVEQGFEAWWPSDRLAVHGYSEVIKVYFSLLKLRRELGDRLLAERPAVFVGVDAPDFNLGLEARLKAQGLKTVHFVCPSIWAWRGGRVHKLAASADHVLCLFPFEPALLAKADVRASYVGHPLADAIPLEVPRTHARAALGLGERDVVLAVLPGSRRGEVTHIAPDFLRAAVRLKAARPELRCLLPVAPGVRALVDAAVVVAGAQAAVELVDGRSHEVLAACDVALVASGTATLETALFKRPMVIGYRVAPLSYQIMRHMRYQPWIGLPNVLAESFVVPEFVQEAMTPEALSNAVLAWLDDPAACEVVAQRFLAMHHELRRDTARAATAAIAEVAGA